MAPAGHGATAKGVRFLRERGRNDEAIFDWDGIIVVL